jgi:hypothetical protein
LLPSLALDLLTVKQIDSAIAGIENSRMAIIFSSRTVRTEMVVLQERLLRGKEAQRRRGEYLGGQVPFGLAAVRSLDKKVPTYLVVDPEAAALIKEAAEMILAGASIPEITRQMECRRSQDLDWCPSGATPLFVD